MTTDPPLGKLLQEFEPNPEWWRTMQAVLICMAVFGVSCLGYSCYHIVQAGKVDLLNAAGLAVGPLFAAYSGWMIHRLRPPLLSVAVHELGISVCERTGETQVAWESVHRIVESRWKSTGWDVRRLEFENAAGEIAMTGSELTILNFDGFATVVGQVASERAIEWVNKGDVET